MASWKLTLEVARSLMDFVVRVVQLTRMWYVVVGL